MIKVLTVCPSMNDDDVDFKPSQSTRPHSSGNVSLTYTAPKAPKDGEGPPQQRQSTSKSGSNEKLKIIISKTVQVYKLENEKYVNQGTAGVAIVGNYDLHMYQIILYKNNKEHMCKIVISINFAFTILENNYASFYDSSGQNWSILFSTLANAQDFAKQIAIAKFNSQNNPDKLVIQDLLPVGANKHKATTENAIKLKCNSYMLNKEEIVPLKEKPSMFVELLDCTTFPWHEGLKNCTEQCQRVIIMPHKMSAPWTEDIPPTAAVLLEFKIESITTVAAASGELEKMKLPKGGNAANIQEEIQADSSGDEDGCRERMSTLQERVLLSKVQKMDLITRIAKMGHPLPLKGAFISEPCESQEETHPGMKPPQKPRAANNAVQFNQIVPADSCPCYSHDSSPKQKDPQNQMVTMTFQRSGVNVEGQQIFPFVTGPCSSKEKDEAAQTLGSKNIELGLRQSIDKISEKVDNVLNKLEHLDLSNRGKMKELPGQTSDPAGVITTIQGVMSENETLKNDMKVMKSKIEEQNRKIQSLMDLTQSCVDKCSSAGKRNDGGKRRVSDAEENPKSSDLIMQATSRINHLISYVDNYRKELLENHSKINESNLKVQQLTEKLKEKDEELQNMEEELNLVRKEYMSLTVLNESRSRDTIGSRSEDFGGATEITKEPASEDYLYDEIKKVMNAINRRLQSSFENEKNYSGIDVKDKIARTIKGVFMAYMKYKSKGRSSSSREDARAVAERRSGSREMSSQSHGPETDPNSQNRADDLPRIPMSRIKFADDQEYEINRVEENFEEVKQPREVYKKSVLDRSRSDSGASGQSVVSHASPRDGVGTTEASSFSSVVIPGAIAGATEGEVSDVEKSELQLTKESRSRSRSQKFSVEYEDQQHSESGDELSKKSEILEERPSRSVRDSSPRLSFEHEVEYGGNFDEISRKSEVLDEAARSVRGSRGTGLTFEQDARHHESADELFKKSEILDEEAVQSARGSQSRRSTFERDVERGESREQTDEHSKRSEVLDEETIQSARGSQSRRSTFARDVEQEESPEHMDEHSKRSEVLDDEAIRSARGSQSRRSTLEHDVEREESGEQTDDHSKRSEVLDDEAIRSARGSQSRRSTFERDVERGESREQTDDHSKRSEVLDEETIQSARGSQSRRSTFARDVEHEESPEHMDEHSKRSEVLDDEAIRSARGSQSRRSTLEHDVEREESGEQTDDHSKGSEVLDDEATRSVRGLVSRSSSHGRSDTAVESKTDYSTQRRSGATDGSVSSEIRNLDNLSEKSELSMKKPSEIEHEERSTSQTDSQTSTPHSGDEYPTSRKSTNENSMSVARSDSRPGTENVTSGTNLDKTPLDVTSSVFQEPVLKSILKNKEAGGSTVLREENDFSRTRTSSHLVDEAADGKSVVSTERSSRTPSNQEGNIGKISDFSLSANSQEEDLESEETEKSMENLSNEPSSDFNNSRIQSQASGVDRKSVEEKLSRKESVKEEKEEEEDVEVEVGEVKEEEEEAAEKRKSTIEAPNDSTNTSRMSSIKSETQGADTGTKEDTDDDGSRINDEEEKVESSENESSDSSRNSIPEKSGLDDGSDERSENGPVDNSQREDGDPPGQMSMSGLSELNNSNVTVKNFGTKRNSREGDEERRSTKGGMDDDDSVTRKISYIIKEGEIEPSAVRSSVSEGFMKNYFRSLSEICVEDTVAGYYGTEEENRMGLREDEKANEGSMKEEDVESGEEGDEEKYNYKDGSIHPRKNVTFTSNPNWDKSNPPPLPLDGDDSSSQDDEEWL